MVVTSFPTKAVLHKPEVSGRLAKWAIELGEYDVIFRPSTAIKSQVLADFVAEFSPAMLPALEQEVKLRDSEGEKGEWTLYFDGSSNVRGAGVGLVLTSPTEKSASRAVRCNFKATNNKAEYEALIVGPHRPISADDEPAKREAAHDATRVQVDSDYDTEDEEYSPDDPGISDPALAAYLEKVVSERFSTIQSMVERLPGVAHPIRRSNPGSYSNTPLVEEIASVEMPRKFSFPSIKIYEGTGDPDNQIAQYKQRMLAV